ncbi:hypothetical protein lbkm_0215 [Lachnospiraceae bacterium KM106-2]|nr:hypothetical protein lbkm_0215 [Lachnospiraceae bacterium KM106-2]
MKSEFERFNKEQWDGKSYVQLQKQIQLLADEQYALFQRKIVPGIEGIIGVRLPVLRKLAKRIAKGNVKSFIGNARYESYEEAMLMGMVLGYVKTSQFDDGITGLLRAVDSFIPHIDNWAVCDSFCSGFKVTKEYKDEVFQYIQKLLQGTYEYEIRVGYVLLMDYYLEEDYYERIFQACDAYEGSEYYVNMAIAWLVSMAYVKNKAATISYLANCKLDKSVYNKALQKVIESKQVSDEDRAWCRKNKS